MTLQQRVGRISAGRMANIMIAVGAAIVIRLTTPASMSTWSRLAMFIGIFVLASTIWTLLSQSRKRDSSGQ
jgi:membrane protein implicated in regulation of membrane protease activity